MLFVVAQAAILNEITKVLCNVVCSSRQQAMSVSNYYFYLIFFGQNIPYL